MIPKLNTTALRTLRNKIRQFLAPPVFADEPDKTRVARVLNTLVLGWSAMMIGAALALVPTAVNKVGVSLAIGWLSLVMLTSKILLQQKRVQGGSLVFTFGLWVSFAFLYASSRDNTPLPVMFATLIVIAGLLVGPRAAIALVVASSLVVFVVRLAASLGFTLPLVFPGRWQSYWVLLTLELVFLVISLRLMLHDLTRSLAQARTLFADVNHQREQLAILVDERTRDLMRSTNYVNATTAVANETALVRGDPMQLLEHVVNAIGRQFGFYHTALFLIDPQRQWTTLCAASGEGGQRLVARGFRQNLGEGIVGGVAQSGQYRLAQDVRQDTTFREDPDLPDTRAELALPLRVRGETVGVLDVHSSQPDAFHEEDLTILQALADQVAIALNNAQLLRQIEESAEAERRAFGEISQEAWGALLKTQTDLGFVSEEQGLARAGNLWEPHARAAAQTGRVVIGDQGVSGDTLAIPIKVREQVVGVIDGLKPQGAAWTQKEIELLQTLTDQLSTALESARLYQDTQRRAARERILREVTARVRSSSDPETVLRALLKEVGALLGRSTFVRLVSAEQLAQIPREQALHSDDDFSDVEMYGEGGK